MSSFYDLDYCRACDAPVGHQEDYCQDCIDAIQRADARARRLAEQKEKDASKSSGRG